MTYDQAIKDYKYLVRTYGQPDDYGSADPEGKLWELINDPSKRRAVQIIGALISYWFQRGPDITHLFPNVNSGWETDKKVEEIRDRWVW